MRSNRKTVTFTKPFKLKGLDGQQPAGDYWIVTDERKVETTLFDAWRRVATQIRLPALAHDTGMEQYSEIDPGDLEDALRADVSGPQPRPAARVHD